MNWRRTTISFVAFVLGAGCLAAEAQQAARMFKIGVLSLGSTAAMTAAVTKGPFAQRLAELGYVEGKHFEFLVRTADNDLEKLPALAEELVRAKVDVIVGVGDPAVFAVRDPRIPVVGTMCRPFEEVTKQAKDGKNLTGITCMATELGEKRFEFFKQAVPRARRVAVLHNPNEWSDAGFDLLRAQAKPFGLVLELAPARNTEELIVTLAAIARNRPDGIFISTGVVLPPHYQRIADFALKEKLPTFNPFNSFTKVGGLMSYGAAGPELPHTAAEQTVRILKGAKARDMPVEQAKRLHLTINLKTAKALGLAIPPSLLARADEVIE